jgi:hypothetical protein
MKNSLFSIFVLFSSIAAIAQSGGNGVYKFLDLPASARSASLGGSLITVRDGDVNLVKDNPAVLDSTVHNAAALTYINYISDVNFGYVTHARHFENVGTFSAGMQYINYGTFTRADERGIKNGEFSAGEYAFDVSYGYQPDSLFSFGGTFKAIYSNFSSDNSFGVAFDLGAQYLSKNKLFSAGLVIDNLGYQIKPYVEGNRESLPVNFQLAGSYKLPKAPIRFTLTASRLETWDLTYNQPQSEKAYLLPNGGTVSQNNDNGTFSFDNFMRHMNIAAEIMPSDNFHLRIGFNYLRKQELSPQDTRSGLAGFSFGTGFQIKRFRLSYGIAGYHLAGFSHHITIATNFSEFKSKG